MKGIILAGGKSTRLYPITRGISKQLLPIYNKPMIFYPLSTLMEAEISDILIISTEDDLPILKKILGTGEDLGINLSYKIQANPNGLAEAFILGENFIGDESVSLILGDNLFFGGGFKNLILEASKNNKGAQIFAYRVERPEAYGVIEFDSNYVPKSIIEKPKKPKSNYAVTGLYFYDNDVIEFAKSLTPSARGELEISEINQLYLDKGNLNVNVLSQGIAWLDTGTHDSLIEASSFVRTIENRQGIPVGSPEVVAYNNSWIDESRIKKIISTYPDDHSYAKFLVRMIED